MAAENPWTYTPWLSDNFARETEALTRALQISISDGSSNSNNNSNSNSPTSSSYLHLPIPSPSTGPARSRSGLSAQTGRVTKRKSRVSKKSTTTFITADAANFRQMVQQVTGVRFSETDLAEPVLKPEPQRPSRIGSSIPPGRLPTLDTSAFLLDRPPVEKAGPTGLVGADASTVGFDFEPLPSFPTLESWGVM